MGISALFSNCIKVSGFIALAGFIFTGSFGQEAPKSASPPDSSKENASIFPFADDVSKSSDVINTERRDRANMLTAVKIDKLAITPAYNALGLLQGRVPGVNISPGSGAPGQSVTVRIRGVGTVNNSDPLYVVDGIPVKSIDFLNPNDIESISILKDASTTAIYGSRNANGVVLVTTKIAREGKSLVSYDFSIGTQQPWRKPLLCNAEQWALLNNEARRAANLPIYSEFENPAILGEGTDWWDEVTSSNTLIQSHNVSVTRGSEKLRYFLSAGYFYQDGTIKGSDLRKAMFRFNARNKLADWISIGNNLGFAHTRTNHVNETDEWNSLLINTLSMDPVTTPRDSAGNLIPSKYNNVKNPVGIVEHTNFFTEKTALNGMVYSMLSLFQAFEFKSIFGIDAALNDSSDFEPRYYIDASDNRAKAVTTHRNEIDYTIVLENTLYYKTDFFANHSLRLAAGTYFDDRQWDRELTQNYSTPKNDPALRQSDGTTGLNPRVNGMAGGNSLASLFGRAEYDFANKYLLTGTFRRYASSNFTPDKSWVHFPSLAGAWKISQEPFMKSLTFIESLKLRAGWGRTGNQEIPDYLFTPTTSGSQNYPLGNISNPGTTFLSWGNPQIHWEVQSATNAGLDISALGNRLEFQTDVFVKKTEDMLVRPTIPFIGGLQTSPMVNRGSLENRGVELAMNYREKLGGFTSNIGLNFTSYKNKILSLGQNNAVIIDEPFKNSGMVTRTEAGHPIGSFYGYKTNGLFQTWEEVNSFTYMDPVDNTLKLVQENAAPGDIRYRDDDGDGKLDRGYIGSPHPKFTMGIHLDLKYQKFDLSLSFLGVYGNEIFNGTRWNVENGTAFTNLSVRMKDRWTDPNSTNDVNMPRMNSGDENNLRISDRFIEDGSFWRLKTLQLGYSFGGALRNKIKFKKCRIFAGAANLFTFTAYSGLEPEISLLSGGVDRGTYPHARTYMAGLNIGL